jgi:hypothetical protein
MNDTTTSAAKTEIKPQAAPVASAESKPKVEGSSAPKESKNEATKQSSKPSGIQNGKGSTPRNIGPRFLKNYNRIDWGGKKARTIKPGEKFVKVY